MPLDTIPKPQIEVVDGAGAHSDAYFTRPGLGGWEVDPLEYLWSTVALDPIGFHGEHLSKGSDRVR
jgi:hypothetical protein